MSDASDGVHPEPSLDENPVHPDPQARSRDHPDAAVQRSDDCVAERPEPEAVPRKSDAAQSAA